MMVFAVHRRFWAIFAASLAAHAVALGWFPLRPKAARALAAPAILASLRLVAAPQSGLTAVPPPAPAVVPQQARQLPPRREHQSARRAVEAAAPPVIAVPAATAATPAATAAPAATASPAPPAAQAAPPAAEAGAVPARSQGSQLEAYRQRLAELFAGQQQYPRIAAQRGWEGEVRLRLRVARKGNLVSVHIDSSSGFDVLDQHALAMLDRLASLPPLPEGLEASEIQVVVPVNYRLRKAT
jgi:protein TonB